MLLLSRLRPGQLASVLATRCASASQQAFEALADALHTTSNDSGGVTAAAANTEINPRSATALRWSSSHHTRYTDEYDGRAADQYDKHHRVNKDIFSRALLVIHPDGTRSVMPRRDALKAAAELGLDLVEFKAPDHGPGGEMPVAKIISYQQLRRERQEARQWSHTQAVAAVQSSTIGAAHAKAHAGSHAGGPPAAHAGAHAATHATAHAAVVQADNTHAGTPASAHAGSHGGPPGPATASDQPQQHQPEHHASAPDGTLQPHAGGTLQPHADGTLQPHAGMPHGHMHAPGGISQTEVPSAAHLPTASMVKADPDAQQEAATTQGQAGGKQRTTESGKGPQPAKATKQRRRRELQQQLQEEQLQEEDQQDRVKIKGVFFSPHIAPHDIQVRLKKIRRWLQNGQSVSLAQEVDSTGTTAAAELALDAMVKQLARVGTPRPGKKSVRPNMVSVVLLPIPAEEQQHEEQERHGHAGKKR